MMSRDAIFNFQPIFHRPDFDYISNINNIFRIADSVLFRIHITKIEDSGYANLVKEYLGNLQSFSSWINGNTLPDLAQGFALCSSVLTEALQIFNESVEKRALYENRRNKLIKMFVGGISTITRGLRTAFNPEVIPYTNIKEDQVCSFILDKTEGSGRKFLFNKRGRHSFVNKIHLLNMQELLVVLRLLSSPSGSQVRTFNKWRDLGSSGAPVRILVQHNWIRKDKVFFLYKANENGDYQAQLSFSPVTVVFNGE